jgi:hypothetical protein
MTGAGAADAPPVSARETPATPTAGKEIFRRFRLELCFACAMVEPSCTFWWCLPPLVPPRYSVHRVERQYLSGNLSSRKSKQAPKKQTIVEKGSCCSKITN